MSTPHTAGRHRRDAGGPQAGRRPAAVIIAICVACCILVAIYGYIASAALGKALRFVWRWLGLRGRLKVGMSASLFAALVASGIDPRFWLAATMAGLAAFTVCGMWLAVDGVRGRRHWRERGGTVITGGGGMETVARNSERLDEHDELLAGLNKALAYVLRTVSEANAAAGLPAPELDGTRPQPALRLPLRAVPPLEQDAG